MREYERAYDEQLRSFYQERIRLEEAGYQDHVKVYVSTLISSGENVQHIAELLKTSVQTVNGWYRNIILNQEDIAFRIDEFTSRRDKNVVRADARTKGAIVKAINDGVYTIDSALEAINSTGELTVTKQTIKNWIIQFDRDYEWMIDCPPGGEWTPHPVYTLHIDDAIEMQELIFQHDREENELASQLRERRRAARQG